jgi:peroxiredoxin
MPGDPAPWFITPSPANPRYHFDSVAGRYIALCFYGSAGNPAIAQMLAALRQAGAFDDDHASFFGVSADPGDDREKRIEERIPGFRLLWDFGLKVAARYGVCDEPKAGETARYQPTTFILDPALRVLAVLPIADPVVHGRQLLELVGRLPPLGGVQPESAGGPGPAGAAAVRARILRELMGLYDRHGGQDSGYMTSDAGGKTVGVIDYGRKRRRDYLIDDADARRGIRTRIERRLIPEVRKASSSAPTSSSATSSPATTPARAAISARTATTPPGAPPIAASPSRSISTPRSMRAAISAFPSSGERAIGRRAAAPSCSRARSCTRRCR